MEPVGRRSFLQGLVLLLGQAATGAAQDAEARYAVAYLSVAAARVSAMADAFRRYRAAAGQESGFVQTEMVEQIGRPGHFIIVEQWKDQATFDAHQSAASTVQFRSTFQAIRTSGYDQRPYQALTAGHTRGARGRDAVYVVAHVDIGGGGTTDVPGLLRRLADTSRGEPGCLRFEVLQHAVRANHFTVIEVWENQRALEQHAAAAHTKQYRDDVQPLTGSPLDERLHKSIE